MLQNKWVALIASLLVAVGSWGATFQHWGEAFQVSNFFGLLGILGGITLAWLGQSPIKPATGGGQ